MARNGYINGRSTPFLVIQINNWFLTKCIIKGLDVIYIMYSDLVGKTIELSAWEDIYINGEKKSPHFESLDLTDYSQDPKYVWG